MQNRQGNASSLSNTWEKGRSQLATSGPRELWPPAKTEAQWWAVALRWKWHWHNKFKQNWDVWISFDLAPKIISSDIFKIQRLHVKIHNRVKNSLLFKAVSISRNQYIEMKENQYLQNSLWDLCLNTNILHLVKHNLHSSKGGQTPSTMRVIGYLKLLQTSGKFNRDSLNSLVKRK